MYISSDQKSSEEVNYFENIIEFEEPDSVIEQQEYFDIIAIQKFEGPFNEEMVDKIKTFYITVTVTLVTLMLLICLYGYICYKRRRFEVIEKRNSMDGSRRRMSRPSEGVQQQLLDK